MGSCGWWLRIWFGSCRISLVGCQPGVQKTDSYRLDYHTVRAASSSSTTHAHLQVLSISCTSIRQAQPSQMPTWLGLASFTHLSKYINWKCCRLLTHLSQTSRPRKEKLLLYIANLFPSCRLRNYTDGISTFQNAKDHLSSRAVHWLLAFG
jgi:hypothetical protein